MSFKVGKKIVRVSNSLDPGETPIYSVSHPNPGCLFMGLWSRSAGYGLGNRSQGTDGNSQFLKSNLRLHCKSCSEASVVDFAKKNNVDPNEIRVTLDHSDPSCLTNRNVFFPIIEEVLLYLKRNWT